MHRKIWMFLIATALTFAFVGPTVAYDQTPRGIGTILALDTGLTAPAGDALSAGSQAKPDALGDQIAGKKKATRKKAGKKKATRKKARRKKK